MINVCYLNIDEMEKRKDDFYKEVTCLDFYFELSERVDVLCLILEAHIFFVIA